MVINYNLINVATNNAFMGMRGSGKSEKKNDFLKQLSFHVAQPHVSNRNLRGKTKLLAKKMGLLDVASNTMNHRVQDIKPGRCYRCVKHTRLACMICRRSVCLQHRKYQTKHIARNAQQFEVALQICVVFCLKYSLRLLKFCCTSAKS